MTAQNIDPASLERLRDQGARVIDVRSDGEVARGVIPGAENIAMDKLAGRYGELERDAPLILYCQSGARSMNAAQFLAAQGFSQVYNLAGGVAGWVASGRPVGTLSAAG